MKKIVFAVAFAMAAGMSSATLAATVFGDTTNQDEVTGGVGGDCPLLADTVVLTVSANVVGGWACNETTNIIQVASCHKGGSRQQGVACAGDADPNTDGIQLPAGCDNTDGYSTIPSFKAFTANSGGGVMTEQVLDQRCTEGQLAGIPWVN